MSLATDLPVGIVSPGNSLYCPPAAVPTIGSPFVGPAEKVLDFPSLVITLATVSTGVQTGTLHFQFSSDGINWDIGSPIAFTSVTGFVPTPLIVILPYFRVLYTPDVDNLTEFRLTTLYLRSPIKFLTRFLNQSIASDEPVERTQAVITGAKPGGGFETFHTDGAGNFPVRPAPATSAIMTMVPAALVPTPLLADDPARLGFSIYNQSLTDVLYLKLSADPTPVSTTFFTLPLQPNAYYEDAFGYTGPVDGIWSSAAPGSQACINDYQP